MTDKEFKQTYDDICNNLAKRRLKPAFDQLGRVIAENGLAVFYDEWQELEQTYQYMLKYTVEGIQDPERQKVYRKLIVSAFELADQINEALRLKYSSSVEYEKKRMLKNPIISDFESFRSALRGFQTPAGTDMEGGSEKSAEVVKRHQQLGRLFHHVWLSNRMNNE
ncbi:MAG: hypothetical protein AAGU19_11665, partial [Prolixibacteraceae bacterium]